MSFCPTSPLLKLAMQFNDGRLDVEICFGQPRADAEVLAGRQRNSGASFGNSRADQVMKIGGDLRAGRYGKA